MWVFFAKLTSISKYLQIFLEIWITLRCMNFVFKFSEETLIHFEDITLYVKYICRIVAVIKHRPKFFIQKHQDLNINHAFKNSTEYKILRLFVFICKQYKALDRQCLKFGRYVKN